MRFRFHQGFFGTCGEDFFQQEGSFLHNELFASPLLLVGEPTGCPHRSSRQELDVLHVPSKRAF